MKPPKKLFSPIDIGTMTLMNRTVMAPMNSRMANDDGTSSQALIDFYTERARGGVGLIVFPSVSVDRISPFKNNLVLWDRKFISSFRDVSQAVQAYGTRIVPQLCHPGIGWPPLSKLSVDELHRMTAQFGDAAVWAREAGCDGVELHSAHARMLLGASISALCNRRTDAYGGSVENRLKLLLEVVKHVKEKAGHDFPVMVRFSGDELVPGGRGIRETQYIAPMMVEAGVDALDISIGVYGHPLMGGVGGHGSPQGITVPLAKAVKEVVDVPVVATGRINSPGFAEDILQRGEADLIALGRPLIADPEWPAKAAEGRFEDIAPCIACGLGCGMREGGLTCLVNPAVGREVEMKITNAPNPKKVMVVGGGPGGMEAARVAALRGHHVTLYEKGPILGGQLNLAAVAPSKQEVVKVVQYLSNQIGKLGVSVVLNTEVTPRGVQEEKPDVVIVATGSKPVIPDIEGLGDGEFVAAYDVLAEKPLPDARNIVVIGGGMVGCEAADFLASQGDSFRGIKMAVTIIEMLEDICLDISGDNRASLLARLREKGVNVITSAKVIRVGPGCVDFETDGSESALTGIDTIVLAMGAEPVNTLGNEINKDREVYVIGDAKCPRTALEAVSEASEIGRQI